MKVFHNKVFSIETQLADVEGVECYLPKETVIVETPDGRRLPRVRPAIAGLLFVKCCEDMLQQVKELARGAAMFYPAPDGTPARIRDHEMLMFKMVTSSGDTGLEYLGDDAANYSVGQRVRVLEGVFKGAEGRIRRIHGNRRLVVSVSGICAVATSYILSLIHI